MIFSSACKFFVGTAAITFVSKLNKNVSYAKIEEYGKLRYVDEIEEETCVWNNDWKPKNNGSFVHHVVLVRHSDYDLDNFCPSSKGALQSEELSQTLIKLLSKFPKFQISIYSSCTQKVYETCRVLVDKLTIDMPCVQVRKTLNETVPHTYTPALPDFKPTSYSIMTDMAFQEIFCKKLYNDRVTLVFGHSNSLRYLLCKALQLPLDSYMRFDMPHCSITWLTVTPRDHVRCLFYGDNAYMPSELKRT